MSLRRTIQVASLGLFLWLLWQASFPVSQALLPVDLFLRLDPFSTAVTALTGRSWGAVLWPALLLLALTTLLGRFFCGYLCPLGTTIDVVDHLLGAGRIPANGPGWRRVPYLVLAAVLGAAAAGVSLVALVAPITLVTRLYATVLYPLACLLADGGLALLRPLAARLGVDALLFQVPQPRVALPLITALLLAAVFVGALWTPRFWCRHLCPAGALLSIAARRPWLRRRVSSECTACGLCQSHCPMAAIAADPRQTDRNACIVCQRCVTVCPQRAVRFRAVLPGSAPQAPAFSAARRQVLGAALLGAGTAMASLTGLDRPVANPVPGDVQDPMRIRPPGALPEPDFLARCVRCGLCQKACPTNTLQSVGLAAGLPALFSPQVTPRRGGCEPLCHACAEVCPTGAIRVLPPRERPWAKIGTAHILRHKCLAWEQGQRCLVCDEGCPFDAIALQPVHGSAVAVPVVDERRCSGCGFCEHLCPVQARAAIVVEPLGALRLESGSMRERARSLGLDLQLRRQPPSGAGGYPPGALPPGFTE
jgi:MauM/NapG family ferredoxin protein